MVALGLSGIGDVQGGFVQNTKKLPDYYAALDDGRFPIERGYELDDDDHLRRHVITALMCNGFLDIREAETRFGIDFGAYFAEALAALRGPGAPEGDGLVVLAEDAITVTPLGRTFVRNVCMPFDRYRQARLTGQTPVFSRTV
jgi:oxygen-independent coproporphyrinogen-3 oxidase